MVRIPEQNIRNLVQSIWFNSPRLTSEKICNILHGTYPYISYKTHGQYVNNLLSEFRSNLKVGLPHNPHKRVFPFGFVNRGLAVSEGLESVGWRLSCNRNKMFVYRGARGSVHWYLDGKVILYMRGEVGDGHVKQLFSDAFRFLAPDLLLKILDVPLDERAKDWVFYVGCPLPKIDIRQFEGSHGLRIFTDESHKMSVEVRETVALGTDKLIRLSESQLKTMETFAVAMKSHLALISEIRGLVRALKENVG